MFKSFMNPSLYDGETRKETKPLLFVALRIKYRG